MCNQKYNCLRDYEPNSVAEGARADSHFTLYPVPTAARKFDRMLQKQEQTEKVTGRSATKHPLEG